MFFFFVNKGVCDCIAKRQRMRILDLFCIGTSPKHGFEKVQQGRDQIRITAQLDAGCELYSCFKS